MTGVITTNLPIQITNLGVILTLIGAILLRILTGKLTHTNTPMLGNGKLLIIGDRMKKLPELKRTDAQISRFLSLARTKARKAQDAEVFYTMLFNYWLRYDFNDDQLARLENNRKYYQLGD